MRIRVGNKRGLDVEDRGRTKDPWGNPRAGLSAKTTIDREAFGLVWNQVLVFDLP